MSSADRVHRPGADRDRIELLHQLLEGDVTPDSHAVAEADAQPLDQLEVHLDRLTRQAEGRHADEHRAAAVGQLVEDRDLVAGSGQLARHGDAGRAGADDRDGRVARRDLRHVVGDAGRLVPLDEEALHGPDRQRPVDVAAAAGALARGRADVGAHRGDRIRLARQDVALFESAFGGQIQVAAAVRADGARFLALDVALKPGGVDRLNQEFLVGIDGQESVLLGPAALCCHRARSYHRKPQEAVARMANAAGGAQQAEGRAETVVSRRKRSPEWRQVRLSSSTDGDARFGASCGTPDVPPTVP